MSQTPSRRRTSGEMERMPDGGASSGDGHGGPALAAPLLLDLALVLLLLAAALATLALLGAGGSVLAATRAFLTAAFGWGAWLLPAGLLGAGWLTYRSRIGRPVPGATARLIALEVAALLLLGIGSAVFAPHLSEAEAGRGGGLVGWGITFTAGLLLPVFWQVALMAPLAIGLILWGFGASLERLDTPHRTASSAPVTRRSTPHDSAAGRNPNAAPAAPEEKKSARAAVAISKPPRTPKPAPAIKLTAPAAPAQKTAPQKIKRPKSLPPLSIFDSGELSAPSLREINQIAGTIERTLAEFDIPAKVISYRTGPTVTQFGVEPGFLERPGPGGETRRAKVRVSQISSLADDLALALAAPSLRIEAPVPGQSYVGVEVPHKRSSVVRLRNVMESSAFQKVRSPLAVALGLDVAGQPVCADLSSMPHLLIAGTTGSGKSVCITALTACLVANNPPEALRLVLIDPKMVELVRFNGLPHILGKVETDLERIVTVLRWCTKEMDRRYKLLEQVHARHIGDYNRKVEQREEEPLPRMVVVLDEMADLMMMAPDETERTLIRLAQMARAVGIHLVVATQRPSTDVVTGLIKANFPARIAFAVASSVDSRVILDSTGAESLLGKGDMLYLSPEAGAPVRLQGCFLSDREIIRVTEYWKEQGGGAEPAPAPRREAAAPAAPKSAGRASAPAAESAPVAESAPWEGMVSESAAAEGGDGEEAEIEEAIRVVKQYGRASASLLQRKMRLGYPRAAHLMDVLQERGLIGRAQSGGKTRELLVGRGETAQGEDEAA